MIKAPKAFSDACRNMGPYLEDFVQAPEDLGNIFLMDIGATEASVIAAFIDELLNARYSPDQLKEFWWSMPATTVFHRGEDVAVFLKLIQKMLSLPPHP